MRTCARVISATISEGHRSHLIGRNSPHQSSFQIRQPNRTQTCANAVAAIADPLSNHLIAARIDPCQRNLIQRRPYRAESKCDLPTMPRKTRLNVRHQLASFRVHPRNRSISLIERPHRSRTGSRKERKPSANSGQKEPEGTVIDATTELFFGSMRESVPPVRVASHTLSAPMAIHPSESPGPA